MLFLKLLCLDRISVFGSAKLVEKNSSDKFPAFSKEVINQVTMKLKQAYKKTGDVYKIIVLSVDNANVKDKLFCVYELQLNYQTTDLNLKKLILDNDTVFQESEIYARGKKKNEIHCNQVKNTSSNF